MKKKILVLAMGLSCFQFLNAQQQTYTISNDESKEQNLLVGISLLDFTLGSAALSLSGGADADFFFDRMSVEAGFRFSYYDLKKSIIKATNESTNSLKT